MEGRAVLRPPPARIGHAQLFLAFLQIALSGFGGVLPWARRVLVERRHWLTGEEFAEILGLGQALPGPNIVNVSVAIGTRFRGASGAVAAYCGLMLAPVAIVLALAFLYGAYGQSPRADAAFRGISAAAAGLVVAMALKMAAPLRQRLWAVLVATLAFVAIGIVRLPLPLALLLLLPLGTALARRFG